MRRFSSVAASRVASSKPSVFSHFSALALKHGAVNLGQGFPDFETPDFVKSEAAEAIKLNHNQYARSAGHPLLVEALSKYYEPRLNRRVDPMTEIVVGNGATEATFATMQGLLNPGDEVILFEPFYDAYPEQVKMAGGIPRYVPLKPPRVVKGSTSAEWTIDAHALTAAISPRTKMIIVNTPHNPIGKIFSADELAFIAGLAKQHNFFVVADEVYDEIHYEEVPFVRMATLPGMADRTITIGSAGKTFSCTGWKIGWVVARPDIANAVFMAHQWIPFAVTTPLQVAVAKSLEIASKINYFQQLKAEYKERRSKLFKILDNAGFTPTLPHGSYFILADTSRVQVTPGHGGAHDFAVCESLVRDAGVVAIPPSAFYCEEHRDIAANFARFAFCKTDLTLAKAEQNLKAYVCKH